MTTNGSGKKKKNFPNRKKIKPRKGGRLENNTRKKANEKRSLLYGGGQRKLKGGRIQQVDLTSNLRGVKSTKKFGEGRAHKRKGALTSCQPRKPERFFKGGKEEKSTRVAGGMRGPKKEGPLPSETRQRERGGHMLDRQNKNGRSWGGHWN